MEPHNALAKDTLTFIISSMVRTLCRILLRAPPFVNLRMLYLTWMGHFSHDLPKCTHLKSNLRRFWVPNQNDLFNDPVFFIGDLFSIMLLLPCQYCGCFETNDEKGRSAENQEAFSAASSKASQQERILAPFCRAGALGLPFTKKFWQGWKRFKLVVDVLDVSMVDWSVLILFLIQLLDPLPYIFAFRCITPRPGELMDQFRGRVVKIWLHQPSSHTLSALHCIDAGQTGMLVSNLCQQFQLHLRLQLW